MSPNWRSLWARDMRCWIFLAVRWKASCIRSVRDRAVIALTPTGESVVIVGYDMFNTILYNPATKETYYYGINDSTNLFNSAGNVFYSYMETFESRTAH